MILSEAPLIISLNNNCCLREHHKEVMKAIIIIIVGTMSIKKAEYDSFHVIDSLIAKDLPRTNANNHLHLRRPTSSFLPVS
jgi:hypothetical protein